MKKKVLGLMLCVAMAASMLVGCSTKTPGTESADSGTEAESDAGSDSDEGGSADGSAKIGITIQSLKNDYWAGVMGKLEEMLKEKGYEYTLVDCEDNSAKQINDIENFITSGCDLIMVHPSDAAAVETVCGEALDAGIGEFSGKLPQLMEGFTALSDGIDKLSGGAKQLDTGLAQLKTAGAELKAGALNLKDGANELSVGADALASGSITLKDGAEELYRGTGDLMDGAGKLKDGAKELSDGTVTLSDGMAEYSGEGIGKLLDALDDADLTSVYKRLDAMIDAAGQYKSFTGVSDEMDGDVTFLIRTESIEKQ